MATKGRAALARTGQPERAAPSFVNALPLCVSPATESDRLISAWEERQQWRLRWGMVMTILVRYVLYGGWSSSEFIGSI